MYMQCVYVVCVYVGCVCVCIYVCFAGWQACSDILTCCLKCISLRMPACPVRRARPRMLPSRACSHMHICTFITPAPPHGPPHGPPPHVRHLFPTILWVAQLPLPRHLSEEAVMEHLDPHKDVDGFHPLNMGCVMRGGGLGFASASPACFFLEVVLLLTMLLLLLEGTLIALQHISRKQWLLQ